MLFADEHKLLEACARCTSDINDVEAYDELMMGCRNIGKNLLRLYSLMPSANTRMIYAPYSGSGIISFNKTVTEFSSRGKSLNGVISRYRVRDVKKLHVAIIYDDSDSMTAWYRNKFAPKKITDAQAPQAYAKLACLSLMEGLGREVDINLWTFGAHADGPFSVNTNMYKQLITHNGSGGTRLDLALQSVIDYSWYKKMGTKIAIILTDGIPEMGNSDYSEDVLINVRALDQIKYLVSRKVKVLYLQLNTDDARKFKKSGGYTMKEFGHNIQKMGCCVVNVDTAEKLGDSLFNGIQEMTKQM